MHATVRDPFGNPAQHAKKAERAIEGASIALMFAVGVLVSFAALLSLSDARVTLVSKSAEKATYTEAMAEAATSPGILRISDARAAQISS